MLHYMYRIKMDEIKEDGGSGGGSKEESKGEEGSKSAGDNLDENGYEIHKEEGAGKEEPKGEEGKKSSTGYDEKDESKKVESKKESSDDDEKVKDPASGYGEDEPKEIKKAESKDEPKDESKDDKEVKLDTEGLVEEEVNELKDFIKKHGVNQELAQALVDQRKDDAAKYKKFMVDEQAEVERVRQETKIAWHRELKTDPDFGGENFSHSIKNAEKVIEEFLPNLKKVLTERATMLPPYVMKDLAKLAGTLYSTEKLNQGDPSGKVDEKNEEDDSLEFYNS